MGKLVGERRRETEKEREREIEREGGVKQMCQNQNCIPTMNMNTLWYYFDRNAINDFKTNQDSIRKQVCIYEMSKKDN